MRYGYYDALDVLKLGALCTEVCDVKNKNVVYNTLLRNKVYSIDVLKICDPDKVKTQFRGIGDRRLGFIKEMIDMCNDEEKIREILSKDEDIKRLEENRNLYELAVDLYNNHECSCAKVARITGLKEETILTISV